MQRIEAQFLGHAYDPHRHDTYSIGYTICGVQSFDYRGARADSMAGQVIVLHPDELHDGHAGSDAGFRYCMLYIEPSLIRAALGSSATALPFVKDAVLTDRRLTIGLATAFEDMETPLAPLQLDQIVVLLADGLLDNDRTAGQRKAVKFDAKAIEIAREYLNANIERVVRSEELESATQQDRYSLARQFRAALGTSPYRYQTMRRIERARDKISQGATLAEAALTAGFSDQAHMTRRFKSTFGLSPGRWRRLQVAKN